MLLFLRKYNHQLGLKCFLICARNFLLCFNKCFALWECYVVYIETLLLFLFVSFSCPTALMKDCRLKKLMLLVFTPQKHNYGWKIAARWCACANSYWMLFTFSSWLCWKPWCSFGRKRKYTLKLLLTVIRICDLVNGFTLFTFVYVIILFRFNLTCRSERVNVHFHI